MIKNKTEKETEPFRRAGTNIQIMGDPKGENNKDEEEKYLRNNFG